MKTKIKSLGKAFPKLLQTISTFAFFVSLTALPCNAQSLASIEGSDVVATAGLGSNEVKVITLTPRWINCIRFADPGQCIRENQGTFKTTYTVNCAAKSVHSSNEFGSGVDDIDPDRFSRATSLSFGIYDYACGTNYSTNY